MAMVSTARAEQTAEEANWLGLVLDNDCLTGCDHLRSDVGVVVLVLVLVVVVIPRVLLLHLN